MPDPQGTTTDQKPATNSGTAGAEGDAGAANPKPNDSGDGTIISGANGADKGDSKPNGNEGDKNKPEGAPEKYADFKLPEGVVIDAETSKTFQETAKALNLTQDQAQKLIDLQSAHVLKAQKTELETYDKMRAEWKSEAEKLMKAQPEKTQGLVAQARDRFASKELVQFLNETGLGNHPEMVRLFIKLGEAIADDTVVDGGKGGGEAKSHAEMLYPNQKK